MRKRILLMICILALLVAGMFIMSSCSMGGSNNTPTVQDCVHSWSEWIVRLDPTCTAVGNKEHICTKCGASEREEIEPLGHKGGAATCADYAVCTVCHSIYGELKAHEFMIADCNHPKTCKVCYATEGEPLPHVGGKATCDTLAECEKCGSKYGTYAPHNFTCEVTEDLYKAADATCINAAFYYYSCDCGAKGSSVFSYGDPLGHNNIYMPKGDGTHTVVCKNDSSHTYSESCSGGERVTCIDKAVCEYCFEEYGEPLGHDWQEIANADDSTPVCNEIREIGYKCAVCEETKTEMKVTEHKYSVVSAVASSCTSKGYTTYKCEVCADEYTVDSETLASHVWDKEAVTCDSGRQCSKCDAFEPALGHSYEIISESSQTCTTFGKIIYECTVCEDTYESETGAPLGHDIDGVEAVLVLKAGETCSYVENYKCKTCRRIVIGETVEQHKYSVSVVSATCKEDGLRTLTCTLCNSVKTEIIEKNGVTGHNWIKGNISNGKRTDSCQYCEETKIVTVYEGTTTDSTKAEDFKDTEIELNDVNISMDDGVIDTIGDKDITISVGKLEGTDRDSLIPDSDMLEQIGDSPIYNFTISDGNDVISKFGEDNYVTITIPYVLSEGEDVDSIAIWYISDDGELTSVKAEYNNGYVTFKTDHFSYYVITLLTPDEKCELYGHNTVTIHVEGGCTEVSYDLVTCILCNKSFKENVVLASGHSYVSESLDVTCSQNGYILYSCENCDSSYRTVINALGHVWNITEISATCTSKGYVEYSCENCEEKYKVEAPQLRHEFEETVVEASCFAGGYTHHLCTVCGYEYTDKIVAPLGHSIVLEWVRDEAELTKATVTLTCSFGCEFVHTATVEGVEKHVDPTCYSYGKDECVFKYVYNGVTYETSYVEEIDTYAHEFDTSTVKHDKNSHWFQCKYCSAQKDARAHSWDSGKITKNATCNTEGEKTYVCSCGETKTEKIAKNGNHNYVNDKCTICGDVKSCEHVYNSGAITTRPTCSEEGVRTYTCNKCGATKSESIAKSQNHSYDAGQVITPAGCVTNGVKTYTCNICAATKNEIIKSRGSHTLAVTVIVAPGCETTGLRNEVCTLCGETKTNVEIPSLGGHKFGESVVTTPSSCFTDGVLTSTCQNCSEIKLEIITAPGKHSYGEGIVTTEPTCVTEGVKTYTCTVCDNIKTEAILATGIHTYDENGIVITEPTCTENGVKAYSCTVCESVKTETIEALSHSFDEGRVILVPTCDTEGAIGYTCANCGSTEIETIDATGHSYGEGVETTAPTCAAEGVMTYTCTVCGAEKTEIIPETEDHQYANGCDADCDVCGEVRVTEHTYDNACDADCNECGEVRVSEHIYGEGVETAAPTCTESGVITYTCTVCGNTYTSTVSALGHDYVDGVCTVCGKVNTASDAYYINLVSSWKNITGFTLRIENLTYEMVNVDSGELEGSITQTNIAALELYVENGEIFGSAKGEVVIFNGPYANNNAVYSFVATIENGYVYITATYGLEDSPEEANVKMSVDSLLEMILSETELNDLMNKNGVPEAIDFICDTLLPMVETLVELNSEDIDAVLENAFNMIFSFEENADGTVVVTLDFDKIYELNENLATKPISEVIDIYFGENTFNSIVEFAREILNLEISEIPAYLDGQGLDSAELIAKINALAAATGAPENFDISEFIYGEELAGVTVGMLIFETDNAEDYEGFVDNLVSVLGENSLYAIIEAPESLKENIDAVIDMVSGINVSFITDSYGMLTNVNLNASDFTLEIEGMRLSFGVDVNIGINDRLEDTSWNDIADGIEGGIVMPEEDMYEEEVRVSHYNIEKGYVVYNGVEYYYENGIYVSAYQNFFNRISGIAYMSDCGDWKYYSVAYAARVCRFTVCAITVDDGSVVTLIIDDYSGEMAELKESADGITVVYADGTSKELVLDMQTENMDEVMDLYANIYLEVFDNTVQKINFFADSIDFYYNASTGEYSEDTHHEFSTERVDFGDSCEDGYTLIKTCNICGYHEEETRYGHQIISITEINLSDRGMCGGYIRENVCPDCNTVTWSNIEDYYCRWNYVETTADGYEIYNCIECGAVKAVYRSSVSLGNCMFETTEALVYTNSDGEEIYKYERIYRMENHNFEQSYEFFGDSCEDGYKIIERCLGCGYSHAYENYGHRIEVKETDLGELGLCGGYMREEYCTVCNTITYSYVGDWNCNWNYVENSADGYSVYHCENCGTTKMYRYTQSDIDANCRYEYTEVYIYVNASGETVFRYDKSGYGEVHEYVYAYEFFGDDCEDGYIAIGTCRNCGYASEEKRQGHRTVSETILLGDLGLCGGYLREETCTVCGKITHASFEDWNCSWNYVETNDEGYEVHECLNCHVTKMYRYSTGETLADCRYEYLETRIYINTSGEEVYKYEYTGYGYSHNYTYSYEPKGDTCADGVICIANCLNCGNHFEMMMFNPCNDGNADGFCDVCDTEISIPECEQHNDFNSDGICDDCGEEFYCECVDENGDTYCDYCQAYVEPMKK